MWPVRHGCQMMSWTDLSGGIMQFWSYQKKREYPTPPWLSLSGIAWKSIREKLGSTGNLTNTLSFALLSHDCNSTFKMAIPCKQLAGTTRQAMTRVKCLIAQELLSDRSTFLLTSYSAAKIAGIMLTEQLPPKENTPFLSQEFNLDPYSLWWHIVRYVLAYFSISSIMFLHVCTLNTFLPLILSTSNFQMSLVLLDVSNVFKYKRDQKGK